MLIRSKSTLVIQRPSTAVPKTNMRNDNNENVSLSNGRQTLNNLIPDLPSFSSKNGHSSALLYSKFIMKGINANKVDLVKQSFNMKKQNIAYQKKNSLNYLKTLKSTVNTTKNQIIHHTIQNPNKEKTNNNSISHFNDKQISKDDPNTVNLQLNSFIRIKSAKKQISSDQIHRNLQNVHSQRILMRPKSAVQTPQKLVRNTRAQTAKNKKQKDFCNPFTEDYQNFTQFKTERKVSAFVKIQQKGGFFVNHIQRNKRLLSANSNKNSVYLTGIDSNNKNIQNQNIDPKRLLIQSLKKKLSPSKNKQVVTIEDFNQDDNQIERKRVPLSQREIEEINKKSKVNAEFMKKNMPHQYKKYVLYLQMKQNNLTQKDRALLSIDLDRNSKQFGQNNKRYKNYDQAFEQAKQYYQDCADLCDQALHHVNLFRNKLKMPKVTEQILNVENCQQLLKLEKQRTQIQQKQQKNSQQNFRLTEIKQKMYQLVKKLIFFKQKSQDICKDFFNLQFKILTIEQDQLIIKKCDQLNFIYVILNGSVVKKTTKQKIQQNDTDKKLNIQGLQLENSLFDGQSFGQPQNKSDENYNYEIISSQKVLLMKIPYFQYCKIYKQNSNIKERIEILAKIFGNVPGCRPLNNQNLQELALEMQSLQFQAKQIILRKGDPCQKLIIVDSGKVMMTNQHILKRQKKNSKDVKKISKSLTKLNLKDYSIQNLRRKNLKNYEILHQNEQQFVFYYQDVTKQLIKSDAVNWQGFYHQQTQNQSLENKFITQSPQVKNSKDKVNPFTLNYSLISKAHNTKIYLIDMKRLYKLPELTKQVIDVKVNLELSEKKKMPKDQILNQSKNQNSIQKWDKFKQKLCNQIVISKIKV